jgi:hypothetical protein
VLVVWEPILATDWKSPSANTLARIRDQRARQFWDSKHAVASALSEIVEQNPPQPAPTCCVQQGFYWDDAIVYAAHAHWKDGPISVFWNGPVVRIVPALENALNEHRCRWRGGAHRFTPEPACRSRRYEFFLCWTRAVEGGTWPFSRM